ncbi:hypothetical protein TNIN_324801 [Trichonephila inaurata madagascariensis]|uniref:Uncharacterized protein n=1 Tax=Trichonephila inaurata madagascariensis TaxID=2747483 RepID=A0A8X6XT27_9ARAC|nr:hypothetical protein TNIN_324801 [Trichonephila inaurata madagascariensis]
MHSGRFATRQHLRGIFFSTLLKYPVWAALKDSGDGSRFSGLCQIREPLTFVVYSTVTRPTTSDQKATSIASVKVDGSDVRSYFRSHLPNYVNPLQFPACRDQPNATFDSPSSINKRVKRRSVNNPFERQIARELLGQQIRFEGCDIGGVGQWNAAGRMSSPSPLLDKS